MPDDKYWAYSFVKHHWLMVDREWALLAIDSGFFVVQWPTRPDQEVYDKMFEKEFNRTIDDYEERS